MDFRHRLSRLIPRVGICLGLSGAIVFGTGAHSAVSNRAYTIASDSVGPVKLGMTAKQAERALGTKLDIDDSQQPGGNCKYARRSDGRDSEVSYMLLNGRIERIDLFGATTYQMAGGIRIGSTIENLKSANRGKLVPAKDDYGQDEFKIVNKHGGIIVGVDHDLISWIHVGRYPALGFSEGCL